jgi:streptogramin lyase
LGSLVLGLAVVALLPAAASAAPAVTGEFRVAAEIGANNKLAEGPDGDIWVTLESKRAGEPDVARVNARTGEVSEFDLPSVAGVFGITAAGTKIWLTQDGGGVGPAGVTSFSPSDPIGTRRTTFIAGTGAECPIVLGPDGNLWLAAPGGLIRIEDGPLLGVKSFAVAGLSPKDMDVAGSRLVIADAGAQRILTATAEDPPRIVELPLSGAPQGVAGAPSGTSAFSMPPGQLGLLTLPGSPRFTESAGSGPFGVALGSDGVFWFAQFARDSVTGLAADGRVVNLAAGFAKGSGPRQIAAGPDGTLWVTLQTSNEIGRVSGLEPLPPPSSTDPPRSPAPPPASEPRTRIDRGPKRPLTASAGRATATFRFSSPDAGSSFECRLVRVATLAAARADSSAAPRFRPCRSPKAFSVGPGRYRFEVRAVRAGLTDRSPAARVFDVGLPATRRG